MGLIENLGRMKNINLGQNKATMKPEELIARLICLSAHRGRGLLDISFFPVSLFFFSHADSAAHYCSSGNFYCDFAGQLSIVGGGWVSHDEALTTVSATLDQVTRSKFCVCIFFSHMDEPTS